MEEKKLTERESLELISQMIRSTRENMEVGSGNQFLAWGYFSALLSVLFWDWKSKSSQKVRISLNTSASLVLLPKPMVNSQEIDFSTLQTSGPCSRSTTFVMSKQKWAFSRDWQSSQYQLRSGKNIISTKKSMIEVSAWIWTLLLLPLRWILAPERN